MTSPRQLRVMFVDDESRVLQGLQRMLRPLREEWDMLFLESGEDALAEMARCPVDVVVSDMRMPRMSGADLLGHVMRAHPATVRIILSGQADRDLVHKTIGPTHQYLAKPCDADLLKATVDRAARLRHLLANDQLRLLAGKLDSLPSLPVLYLEVVGLLQNPASTIATISKVIGKDLGMSAKILQLVNSAFFGLRRTVSSLEEAVNLLGIETIQSLVLSIHAFNQLKPSPIPGFSLENIWHHSMAVSSLARRLSRAEGVELPRAEEAVIAGMLHDIGRVILATNLPQAYAEVLAQAKHSGRPLVECERAAFGANHAEVGAYLLGIWGLSDPIVEAVAYHHTPQDLAGRTFGPVAAIHIADALHHAANGALDCGSIDAGFLNALGLSERLPAWIRLAETNTTAGDQSHA